MLAAEDELANERNEDVDKLTTAYVNEKCSPIILPYRDELVSVMMELVNNQVRGGKGMDGCGAGLNSCLTTGGSGGGHGARRR